MHVAFYEAFSRGVVEGIYTPTPMRSQSVHDWLVEEFLITSAQAKPLVFLYQTMWSATDAVFALVPNTPEQANAASWAAFLAQDLSEDFVSVTARYGLEMVLLENRLLENLANTPTGDIISRAVEATTARDEGFAACKAQYQGKLSEDDERLAMTLAAGIVLMWAPISLEFGAEAVISVVCALLALC